MKMHFLIYLVSGLTFNGTAFSDPARGKGITLYGVSQHSYVTEDGPEAPDMKIEFSLTIAEGCLWRLTHTNNTYGQVLEHSYDGTNYYSIVRGAGGTVELGIAKTLASYKDSATIRKSFRPRTILKAIWWGLLSSCQITNGNGTINDFIFDRPPVAIPDIPDPYFYQQVSDRAVNSFGPSSTLFYSGESTNVNERLPIAMFSVSDVLTQDGFNVPRKLELAVFRSGSVRQMAEAKNYMRSGR